MALVALSGGACTLASGEFEPEIIDGQAASPSSDGEAGTASEAPGCSGASCAPAGTGGAAGTGAGECGDGGCPAPLLTPEPSDAGSACPGERCDGDGECGTLVCREGCCVEASCSDGVRNGSEASVDCGGECPLCSEGAPCSTGVDCSSGNCNGAGLCAPVSCDDGVRNQDELGIDCGGSCGGTCAAGSACGVDAECTSGVCGSGACALATDTQCCQAATCGDGVLNGGEADLDCGGDDPLCPRCAPGRLCQRDAQCASGVCEAGRCCGGTSGDCTRCAERLSPTVDCSTAPPGGSVNCAAFLQCLAANASVCTTRSSAGCTNDPGGVCNHNTYGGNDGLGLQHASRVLAEAACTP